MEISRGLENLTISIDATSLGAVAGEFLRKPDYRGELYPVVITGGQDGNYADGFWMTQRAELLTGLIRAFIACFFWW